MLALERAFEAIAKVWQSFHCIKHKMWSFVFTATTAHLSHGNFFWKQKPPQATDFCPAALMKRSQISPSASWFHCTTFFNKLPFSKVKPHWSLVSPHFHSQKLLYKIISKTVWHPNFPRPIMNWKEVQRLNPSKPRLTMEENTLPFINNSRILTPLADKQYYVPDVSEDKGFLMLICNL